MVAYSVCVFIYKFTILTAKGVELYLIFLLYLPSPPVSPFPDDNNMAALAFIVFY